MAKLGDDFRKKIELLERNFSVSCVIFNKFKPIFFYIFTSPTDEQAPKSHKGKKR